MTGSAAGASSTADAKTFTGWKLDYLKAACADPRLSAGNFRLMFRVMSAVNAGTKVAVLGDDTIQDDVAGFKEQGTCRKHRKRIAEVGYWKFRPGSGANATEYTFLEMPAAAVMTGLQEQRSKRHEKRKRRKSDYLLNRRDPSMQTAPSDQGDPSAQAAPIEREQSIQTGGEQSIRTAGAVCVDGYTPSVTPSTIQEAADQKVSSYAHAREEMKEPVCEFGIEVPEWLTSEERFRGAEEISGYIARKAKAAGVGVDEVDMALGDRLSRMALEIAIFPGDNIANFRKVDAVIASLLRVASDAA